MVASIDFLLTVAADEVLTVCQYIDLLYCTHAMDNSISFHNLHFITPALYLVKTLCFQDFKVVLA